MIKKYIERMGVIIRGISRGWMLLLEVLKYIERIGVISKSRSRGWLLFQRQTNREGWYSDRQINRVCEVDQVGVAPLSLTRR